MLLLGKRNRLIIGALLLCSAFTLSTSAYAASVVVNTLADEDNGDTSSIASLIATPGGDGISLREAIIAANNNPGADTITFGLSGAITFSITIPPPLSGAGTTIDGAGNITVSNTTADPVFLVTSANNILRNITVVSGIRDGIRIDGGSASNNQVLGCYVGTNAAGSPGLGNGQAGIYINNSGVGNTIGGTSPGDGNVISGNSHSGIEVDNSPSVLIRGNTIGLTPNQAEVRANNHEGILVRNSGSINGEIGPGNVISGNSLNGVHIANVALPTGIVIAGNTIGTNALGQSGIGNSGEGVYFNTSGTATGSRIGGTRPSDGNTISGNGLNGIRVDSTIGLSIHGNIIGRDSSNTFNLPNAGQGVTLRNSATLCLVGGILAGQGNIIAGNAASGVIVNGAGTLQNRVQGNSIFANSFSTIGLQSGGNGSIARPTITGINRATGTISGSGTSVGDVVCVHADDYTEAEFFVGSVTASGGTWSLTGVDLIPYEGLNFNANRTSSSGNSSEFTNPWADNIVVDTLTDVNDGTTSSLGALIGVPGADGKISLREAITAANSQSGAKSITFGVGGTITFGSVSPLISGGSTTIDGGGQITLSENASGNVLHVTSANNIIRNLTIVSGLRRGVWIDGAAASGNQVLGCYIGTNAAGQSGLGNANDGVYVNNSGSGNTIGGTGPGEGNVISGNTHSGIVVDNSPETLVRGNIIGLTPNTTAKRGNSIHGIYILGGSDNVVTGPGNIIGGNGQEGMRLNNSGTAPDNCSIIGNYIGTNASGSGGLGNTLYGIRVDTTGTGNEVGGTGAGEGNVISGNNSGGILIDSAVQTRIEGNLIGTGPDGESILSNTGDGVVLFRSNSATVGGATGEARNIISGNTLYGIRVHGVGSAGNVIAGNYIGTNAAGDSAIPNTLGGLFFDVPGGTERIGGTVAGESNVISGNGGAGITFFGNSTPGCQILGNRIGLNASGAAGLPNNGHGIRIYNASVTNTTIGGTTAGAGNSIAFNAGDGININAASFQHRIRRNSIHSNTGIGIRLESGANGGKAAPLITSVNRGTGVVAGTSGTSDSIDVFADDAEEGRLYITSATAVGGAWTTSAADVSPYEGMNITATATDGSGNTSAFSAAFADAVAVNTLSDVADGDTSSISVLLANPGADGEISLREALTAANAQGSSETISFGVSGTIEVLSELPHLTGGGTSIYGGGNITLDGGDVLEAPALTITSADNFVSGLIIGGFRAAAVLVTGAGAIGNTIQECVIGSTTQHPVSAVNFAGIDIADGAVDTFIGQAGAGNIIGGNTGVGVYISGGTTRGTVLHGNIIGLDEAGAAAPNGASGVVITDGSDNNTVGGNGEGEGNTISSSGFFGVYISGIGTTGNKVLGNRIGTDAAGSASRPNSSGGVTIENGAVNNDVGQDVTGAGNLISGNLGSGVAIAGAGTTNNRVRGNVIGLDVSGATPLPNALHGISVQDAAGNSLGGATALARNVISGHENGAGIALSGTGTTGNTIYGNYIGCDVTGAVALENVTGVSVSAGAGTNTIGGPLAGQANVISGNQLAGVRFENAGAGNTVKANRIGVGADGVQALSNNIAGIEVSSEDAAEDLGLIVGGETAAEFNTIAHHSVVGGVVVAGDFGVDIRGNSIFSNGAGIVNEDDSYFPVITTVSGALSTVSGTSAFANSEVRLFIDDEDEGRIYLGKINSGPGKVWSFSGLDFLSNAGRFFTATETKTDGSTSIFSVPAAVPDLVPPVITLTGAPVLAVECGTLAFDVDYEFSASDNLDGDVSGDIEITLTGGGAPTNETFAAPGSFQLRYNVSDAQGNAAIEVPRTVQVADTTAPELTLSGPLALEVGCFTEYTDPGFTATDACDGDVEVTVSPVDTSVPGETTVTLTATDDAGNHTEKTRTVTVTGAVSPEMYVAPLGASADLPGRGTESEPFGTIGYALLQAACFNPDAQNRVTIFVAEGTYPEILALTPHTSVIGAGQGLTTIKPALGQLAANPSVAVRGAQGASLESLTVDIPSDAPATRIISINDVSMSVLDVEIFGRQAPNSIGILVREPGSSDTLVKDCRIRSVDTGLNIAFSAARFAFNDFESILGNQAIRIAESSGATPVVGSQGDLANSGSNIFRTVTGDFILTDNPSATAAEANCWENLEQESQILQSIDGPGAGAVNVAVPLFEETGKGAFAATIIVTLLDDDQVPVPDATLTLNGFNRYTLAGSGGVYSADLVPKGVYTLRARAEGFPETVQIVTVSTSGIAPFTMQLGGGVIESPSHSADTNDNARIDLSELLRVVQFFNATGYFCSPGTEDEYAPGAGSRVCDPHSADYSEPAFVISLSELLRLIQWYNVGEFVACPQQESDDGFCAL